MGRKVVVVDVSDFANRRQEIIAQLMEAAGDVGFFYIKGHSIPQEVIDAEYATAKRFFTLPLDIKDKYAFVPDLEGKTNQAGYRSLTDTKEFTGVEDFREQFGVGYDSIMPGLWPSEADCPGWREENLRFMAHCHQLALQLLSCFAEGLGLPVDYFEQIIEPSAPDANTLMNLNHYLPAAQRSFPEGLHRIQAHTDWELITLLFTRPGEVGLEVFPQKEASADEAPSLEWTDMPPIPGAITINIGDSLQYLSDDKLKSTFHRVRVPRPHEYQGERMSIAYFCAPRASTSLQGPLKKYPPATFADIIAARNQKYSERKKEVLAGGPKTAKQFMEVAGPTLKAAVADMSDGATAVAG